MVSKYKIGQPVVCLDIAKDNQPKLLGYVTDVKSDMKGSNFYYTIEWCDDEEDLYPEASVDGYVSLYMETLKEM